MFYNDQGSPFTSKIYYEYYERAGIIQSMSKAGCFYDNVPTERYFNTFKQNIYLHECKYEDEDTFEDDYVAIGSPGLFIPENISEIHISVTFTWDLQEAESLAEAWSRYGNVKIGGSATGMRGEAFSREISQTRLHYHVS